MDLNLWLGWVAFCVILLGVILTAVEHYDRKN
jgi:hypothetical protein